MTSPARNILRGSLLIGLMLWLQGCRSPHFSAATDVDPTCWEHPATITIPNADTLTLRDIGIFLRRNDRFRDDTLTVRVTTTTPDLMQHEEQFLLVMPYAESPAAILHEANVTYRRRVLFARHGNYRLTITPCRPIRGVEAAGIHIQKSE